MGECVCVLNTTLHSGFFTCLRITQPSSYWSVIITRTAPRPVRWCVWYVLVLYARGVNDSRHSELAPSRRSRVQQLLERRVPPPQRGELLRRDAHLQVHMRDVLEAPGVEPTVRGAAGALGGLRSGAAAQGG